MWLAEYLMTPVTPLYDIVPGGPAIDQSYRSAVSERRAEAMEARYRAVFAGHSELTSTEVGRLVGVSKPLVGLRKLESRGAVRMVRMSADKRGRKQAVWEWIK